jgi:hypothetical protein
LWNGILQAFKVAIKRFAVILLLSQHEQNSIDRVLKQFLASALQAGIRMFYAVVYARDRQAFATIFKLGLLISQLAYDLIDLKGSAFLAPTFTAHVVDCQQLPLCLGPESRLVLGHEIPSSLNIEVPEK